MERLSLWLLLLACFLLGVTMNFHALFELWLYYDYLLG
ncbi:hypothetical protein MKleb_3837 [Klebsiella sp. PL-2018]|nr:hypothetical protein MKleb_3837 [Klebsiella sp. PL-2018]